MAPTLSKPVTIKLFPPGHTEPDGQSFQLRSSLKEAARQSLPCHTCGKANPIGDKPVGEINLLTANGFGHVEAVTLPWSTELTPVSSINGRAFRVECRHCGAPLDFFAEW